MLPDNDEVSKLIDANLSELEEKEETKFQVPETIKEPLTSKLGMIGLDLVN